ncbi:MAG TPA: hypothetical protein VMP86_01845 [Candidatus Binatia bacterium]|nr:hypothetical protein [Candidatus Binatia bacterium]
MSRLPPIARIRLARSLTRLLAIPALLLVVGLALGVATVVTQAGTGQLIGIAGGALLVLVGVVRAIYLLSIRLDVEESAVCVSWLGGERIYPLSPGPVTRVRLRGESASRLQRRGGRLGWPLGPARLRGEEEIEIVRLAPTRSAILVPTERGRLAIAAANDNELLDALSRAARARRRLEALVERPPQPPEPVPGPPEDDSEPELTGIERARLADERAAAAEAPPAALSAPAAASGTAVAVEAAVPEAAVPETPVTAPADGRLGRASPGFLRRPRPRAAFVLLPMVGAGMAWGAGTYLGRIPEAGTDLARLTSLALVLAGPATSVGAVMALAWWPRIVGVVVAGGLAASVFIGRALIGA